MIILTFLTFHTGYLVLKLDILNTFFKKNLTEHTCGNTLYLKIDAIKLCLDCKGQNSQKNSILDYPNLHLIQPILVSIHLNLNIIFLVHAFLVHITYIHSNISSANINYKLM